MRTGTNTSISSNGDAPSLVVDMRLPQPPILTCNNSIPLRILVKKTAGMSDQIYLTNVQIELVAYSSIRARDLNRHESDSWLVVSKANMKHPLGSPDDPVDTEWQIDSSIWTQQALPNTLPPSFEACNISRRYELDVRVGLGHGPPGGPHVRAFSIPHSIEPSNTDHL